MYGAADRRIGVCREIVDGSKVVKMQVWEGAYLSRIGRARTAELSFHRRYRLLVIICVAIGRSSPMAGAAVAIAVYSRYTALQIKTILPALSVFSGLSPPVHPHPSRASALGRCIRLHSSSGQLPLAARAAAAASAEGRAERAAGRERSWRRGRCGRRQACGSRRNRRGSPALRVCRGWLASQVRGDNLGVGGYGACKGRRRRQAGRGCRRRGG